MAADGLSLGSLGWALVISCIWRMIASPKFLGVTGKAWPAGVGAAWWAPVVPAVPPTGVLRPDEVGVLGPGELGADEITDGLERRRTNVEAISLGLDLKLITPELRELLGPARHERLRREHARQLAVQGVPLGSLFDRRSLRAFVFDLLLGFPPVASEEPPRFDPWRPSA